MLVGFCGVGVVCGCFGCFCGVEVFGKGCGWLIEFGVMRACGVGFGWVLCGIGVFCGFGELINFCGLFGLCCFIGWLGLVCVDLFGVV